MFGRTVFSFHWYGTEYRVEEFRVGGEREEKERGVCVWRVRSGGGQWRMGTRCGVQFLAFSLTAAVTCKKIKLHNIIIFLLQDGQLFLKLFSYTLDSVMYMLQ